jgi:hypothetical protein
MRKMKLSTYLIITAALVTGYILAGPLWLAAALLVAIILLSFWQLYNWLAEHDPYEGEY